MNARFTPAIHVGDPDCLLIHDVLIVTMTPQRPGFAARPH